MEKCDMIVCENCGTVNYLDPSHCRGCGQKIGEKVHENDAEATEKNPNTSEEKSWGWNCKQCGRFNVTSMICEGCGASFGKDFSPHSNQHKEESRTDKTAGGIACYVPSCTQSVIGQCMGYNRNCGRFYCAQHSSEIICSDCNGIKQSHDIHKDYVETAKMVRKEGNLTTYLFWFLVLPIAMMLSNSMQNSESVEQQILGMLLCLAAPIGLLLVHLSVIRSQNRRAVRISKSKPKFDDFWHAWKKERRKEGYKLAGTLVGAAVLGAFIYTIDSEIEKARIKSAVNEALIDLGL